MTVRLTSLMLAAVAVTSVSSVSAKSGAAQPSEYRPGIKVEPLYHQEIEYYSTDWLGRLEKSEGSWRDIYFEASGKFVNKGILSFNCAKPNADIGLVLYSVGAYGSAADRRTVRVRFADRKAWQAGRFAQLAGETPPFEFYSAALQRFCK